MPSPSSVIRRKTLRASARPLGGQAVDHVVGRARDRGRHAAAGAVALDGERAPVAALPRRAQRVREQRQRAGLGGDVAQDQLHEAGLEPQAREPCRLRDRARELVVGHRAEQHLVGGDRGGEVGVRAEAPVDVGPQADRDAPAPRQQGVDEGGATGGVVAQRRTAPRTGRRPAASPAGRARRARRRRPASRRTASSIPAIRPARAAATRPARSTEDLPLPDAPTTASSSPPADAGDDVGHDRLAAEEEALVAGLERQQAAVRAVGDRRRRSTPGPASAKIRSGAPRPLSRCGPRSTSEQPSGRCPATSSDVTEERKTWPPSACARRRAARIDARAEVVAVARLGLAGVDAPAHGDADPGRPRLGRQRPVGGERGLDRVRRRVEHRDGRVALAHRVDQAAAAGLDGVGDQLVVAHERLGHRLRVRLPQRRRALDVREAERDHAGRQRRPPSRPAGARPARPASSGGAPDRSPCRAGSRPRAARPAPGRCPPRWAARPPARSRSAARTRSPRARRRRWRATGPPPAASSGAR